MTMSDRNGSLVGAEQVWDGDEMMLISNQGTAVRTRVDEVGVQGRNTQGVSVIRIREGEALVSVSRIAEDDVDTTDETALGAAPSAPVAPPADSEGVEEKTE
jgi:DNA gyrase subunit A